MEPPKTPPREVGRRASSLVPVMVLCVTLTIPPPSPRDLSCTTRRKKTRMTATEEDLDPCEEGRTFDCCRLTEIPGGINSSGTSPCWAGSRFVPFPRAGT